LKFGSVIAELQGFAMKADVTGNMRVSIVFSSDRDRAYFERQVMEELKQELTFEPGARLADFRYRGLHIRLLS